MYLLIYYKYKSNTQPPHKGNYQNRNTFQMLNAIFKHTIAFKKLIVVLRELVVDCVIQCKPEGLFLQAMDASHVAMCTFQLDATGFEYYQCEEAFDVGVNLPSLECILKCAKKHDTLSLKAHADGIVLDIGFENTQSSKVSNYELKLMCIDNEQVNIGDIEYDTRIKMHSSSFSEVCKDMQMLGDTCLVSSSSNTLSFNVHGDIGNGHTILQHDDAYSDSESKKDTVFLDTKMSCELTFSLKYLTMFAKAVSLSSTVHISLQENSPLEVKYIMQDIGTVCFYVAPKITES